MLKHVMTVSFQILIYTPFMIISLYSVQYNLCS